MTNPKISICIPTWEQYGYGKIYFEKLLDSIVIQTNKNYNVVVSDHSQNDEIENIIKSFEDKIDIIYIRNALNRGNSPANTNNAIINANGDIIKIMFQDDFFYVNNALEMIINEFEKHNCNWLVSGCNHFYESRQIFSNNMIPFWNDEILIGKNTISSPSVLSFKNGIEIFFDEKLKMLMDCEFYYQLYKRFDLPNILSNILVTNRIHKNQISLLYNEDKNKEIQYVLKKHKNYD